MSWLLVQALWFGLAALIIVLDRQAGARNSELDPDVPDLQDRSVAPFLFLMIIFGGLVIPFYMWISRRSTAAVLVGIGLMVACGIVVTFAAAAILA